MRFVVGLPFERSALASERATRWADVELSLSELANLGEFLGGLAVIVSLFYLAIQIRQNTRTVRASTFQAVADSQSDLAAKFGFDPELGRIYLTGLRRNDELSEAEERQFHFMIITMARKLESAFFQWQSGVLTDEQYKGFRVTTERIFRSPGGMAWWPTRRDQFSDAFNRFVDEAQARGPYRPDEWSPPAA